ncbi:fucolectin-like [Hemiscyllium ocellatum]|uniref:fucolectin-like n=1 Tax=Hemiscyllium ocellatum TaxID=170820 RepID=UPI002966C142|nr:fucolectin-like [Hemiscyllium ocellatum]
MPVTDSETKNDSFHNEESLLSEHSGSLFVFTGNVALGGNASQSSTNWGGDANRAIDGNRNAFYGNLSCTHTNTDDEPWWSLDLFTAVPVLCIKITNRQDCCWQRLRNIEIRVGLFPATQNDKNQVCGNIVGLRAGETKVISCGGMLGRFINIHKKEKGILTLCECEVYAHNKIL